MGESDRLCVILTRERGLVRAFAKGARNIKNKKFSGTGLLCYSSLVFFKARDTYSIDEADVNEVFFGLRSDIERLAVAQYFCEALMAMAPENVGAEDILRLSLNCLHYLSKPDRLPQQIKAIFELRILCLSGYMPNLVACAACATYEAEKMYFDFEDGTIYCENCRPKKTNIAEIDVSVLSTMRHIVFSELSKLFSFSASDSTIKKLSQITERFFLSKVEQHFITLDFYHGLGI